MNKFIILFYYYRKAMAIPGILVMLEYFFLGGGMANSILSFDFYILTRA